MSDDKIIEINEYISLGPSPRNKKWVSEHLDKFDAIICAAENRAVYKLPDEGKMSFHIPIIHRVDPLTKGRMLIAGRTLLTLMESKKKTYIHCWAGQTRCSTIVAIAFSIQTGKSVKECLDELEKISPQIHGSGGWFRFARSFGIIER